MNVLGLPLNEALGLLEAGGYSVTVKEVRSKKGLDGDEDRVVRVNDNGDKNVLVTYANFQTNVK